MLTEGPRVEQQSGGGFTAMLIAQLKNTRTMDGGPYSLHVYLSLVLGGADLFLKPGICLPMLFIGL